MSINDREFVDVIWDYYLDNARPMPWRSNTSPYWIFVSEVMLQQTQVSRVLVKFPPFVERFPDFASLADASLTEVLEMWAGLGYNRRARYLRESARLIRDAGGLSSEANVLEELPGIGPNTAGSIVAFAFNRPIVFIETNIRRVYLHYYFPDLSDVSDREILPLVDRHLDRQNPREWYWALMDHGTMLARQGNANVRSRHYAKQTPFNGSDRQLRGKLVRLLSEKGVVAAEKIPEYTGFSAERVETILSALVQEKIVVVEIESGMVRTAE